jgi:phospholipase D1/2
MDTIWWTNHEKIVVIDQVIGYVGGFDLCWGRYDNNQHPIYEAPNPKNIYEFPMIDYSNNRIKDFSKVDNYIMESVPREQSTRMPWHDVHSRIIGIEVANISKHFIQRWNHANSIQNHLRILSSIKNDSFSHINQFHLAQNFTKINGSKNRALLENFILEEKNTEKNIDDIILLGGENPKFDKIMKNYVFSEIKPDSNKEKNETNKTEIFKKYFTEGIPPSNIQVLRSVSKWSAGVNETEHSILNAYYRLINTAKHYIYIENQFFISKSWNDKERKKNGKCISDKVKNEISYYIRKRIERAYRKKENFKVYIIIPLLPGFEGEPQDSGTIKLILKHTYAGICRNYGLSLIEQLEKIMGNEWKNYIGFFSLRNHALVNNVPKTEIIYIHSKLMIVDDKTVIIGSANINDRSMLGDRDSEFAVIINEEQELENKKTGMKFIMDGKSNYNASNFAVEFRSALMAEHLGISQNDSILVDPVNDKLFSLFINRAIKNSEIYRDLFACYPDDSFVNFQSIKDAQKVKKSEKTEKLLKKYNKLKRKIVGHIVEFPLLFLKEESLETSFFSKEKWIREIIFT